MWISAKGLWHWSIPCQLSEVQDWLLTIAPHPMYHRMMVGGSLAPFHPCHPVPNSPCVAPAVGDCCNLPGDHGCDLHWDHGYQDHGYDLHWDHGYQDHGYDLHGDHGWQRGSSCCVPGLVRLPGAVAWNAAEMDPRKRKRSKKSQS